MEISFAKRGMRVQPDTLVCVPQHAAIPLNHCSSVPWELSSDAPISIRAEGAWKVTRGSKDVTVFIIDTGFEPAGIPPNVCFEIQRVFDGSIDPGEECDRHGALVAQLLCGSRSGYPGVAPHCRYMFMDLPLCCSETEEKKA